MRTIGLLVTIYLGLMSNENPNFYDVRNEILNSGDLDDGSGDGSYSRFKRWEYYWHPRLFENGDFATAKTAILGHAAAMSGLQHISGSNWTEMGPNNQNSGVGRVVDLEILNSNPNKMWAGSWGGGLWHTTARF
jgi:hypothetical protein